MPSSLYRELVQKLLAVLAVPLLIALSAACADGGRDGPTLTVVTSTPWPTGSSSPGQTPLPGATPATPTEPATPPTATSTPGEDGAILLPCGDPMAPVDKLHRLGEDCVPASLANIPPALLSGGDMTLQADALAALEEMLADASDAGHTILVLSAYRSYQHQILAFDRNIELMGSVEEAERVSARPGHSEHQLGTTVDLTSAAASWDLLESFGATPEGQWVAENSWRYGFIISYPEGFEAITGYKYEPWHIRFLGADTAADVHDSGLTLYEYLLR